MTNKEIVSITDKTVLKAFSSEDGLDSVVHEVRDIVDNFEYDLETSKGRSAISSLSGKISSIKVRFDNLGKSLTADWKAKSKAVDASRRKMRDELDSLRDKARLPLTEWENVEKLRILKLEEQVDTIAFYGTNSLDNWSTMMIDSLKADLAVCESVIVDDSWQEYANNGAMAKDLSIRNLKQAISWAEERDRVEVEKQARVDAEKAKAKKEREERIKQEAKEQAEAEAQELAEQVKREADEKAQRLIDEKNIADAKAKAAEEAKIRAEIEAKVKAEQAVEAEKNRVAAALAKEAAEQIQREKDKENVRMVRRAAKEALMEYMDEGAARKVVMAIDHGMVPNVSIKY